MKLTIEIENDQIGHLTAEQKNNHNMKILNKSSLTTEEYIIKLDSEEVVMYKEWMKGDGKIIDYSLTTMYGDLIDDVGLIGKIQNMLDNG